MKNREYYTNGNLKAEYERNELGEKEGYELLYYESGVLRAEYHYKANKLNGVSKEYYENGNLVAEGNYKNGHLEGLSRIYYESGKLKAESNYKNDVLDGLCKMYYENGQVKAEYYYKDGNLEKTISSSKDNEDVKTDEKDFFDVDYENGQLNLKLDLNTLLNSNLSKKDICKISYEDNELKLKIYDEDIKKIKQVPVEKEKDVKTVQEEVKETEVKKIKPEVKKVTNPKKEKGELEIPSFLKSRYEDELEVETKKPEVKKAFDLENDLNVLELVKSVKDTDKELKFAKENDKKPKIKKIIKKVDSNGDEIADIRSILNMSDIETEEEIVRNKGNKGSKENKEKKRTSTSTQTPVQKPVRTRKKDSFEAQKKSVLKMILFILFLTLLGIIFYFLYLKFTIDDTVTYDKNTAVAETDLTTEEEMTENDLDETDIEITEKEPKEKEVTKDKKDTKEIKEPKDKEETKKDTTKKNTTDLDLKKVDEAISQVMDKNNPDYLLKFDAEELALMRNILYARRGLKYTKGKYKEYFESKSWYKPSIASGKDLLPEKEEKLVEIIKKYEKSAKK